MEFVCIMKFNSYDLKLVSLLLSLIKCFVFYVVFYDRMF